MGFAAGYMGCRKPPCPSSWDDAFPPQVVDVLKYACVLQEWLPGLLSPACVALPIRRGVLLRCVAPSLSVRSTAVSACAPGKSGRGCASACGLSALELSSKRARLRGDSPLSIPTDVPVLSGLAVGATTGLSRSPTASTIEVGMQMTAENYMIITSYDP